MAPAAEQDNLHRAMNMTAVSGSPPWLTANVPVFQTVVPVYQCPADAGGVITGVHFTGHAIVNYAGCFSPDGTVVERDVTDAEVRNDLYGSRASENPATRIAVFNINKPRSFNNITDGLSNTVIASEVIGGDYRGAWAHTQGVAYTHHNTPNSTTPDAAWGNGNLPGSGCIPRPNAPCDGRAYAWGLADIAARSNHTGGVNALLGDGSVRFASNTVSLPVWQAAASISGGEVGATDF